MIEKIQESESFLNALWNSCDIEPVSKVKLQVWRALAAFARDFSLFFSCTSSCKGSDVELAL